METRRWVERLGLTSDRPPITERRHRDLARKWPDPDDQLVELERISGVALKRNAEDEAFAVGLTQGAEWVVRYRFCNGSMIGQLVAGYAICY